MHSIFELIEDIKKVRCESRRGFPQESFQEGFQESFQEGRQQNPKGDGEKITQECS